MEDTWILQGREITLKDIDCIRGLIAENPLLRRTRLSQEICRLWNWKNSQGQIKDMACRTLLLKLEKKGLVALPPRAWEQRPRLNKPKIYQAHSKEPIDSNLRYLQPVEIVNINSGNEHQKMFDYLLDEYHYLGYKTSVGENMKYLVFDNRQRILACVLFGSAAWKTTPRDIFIGWSDEDRQRGVNFITNNTRYLILPWVKVVHLASHILSLVSKRIVNDWVEKYNHPVVALETFVDSTRFKGTCYKAANWVNLGQTKGRTRQDRFHKIQASIKDVYFYPLKSDFRKALA